MNGPITAGAGVLSAVGVGAVFLARYWRPARPAAGGRHRAPAALPPGLLPVPAPLPELPRREALDLRLAWCPVEHAETVHVRFALGGLMCRSCPPGGRRDA